MSFTIETTYSHQSFHTPEKKVFTKNPGSLKTIVTKDTASTAWNHTVFIQDTAFNLMHRLILHSQKILHPLHGFRITLHSMKTLHLLETCTDGVHPWKHSDYRITILTGYMHNAFTELHLLHRQSYCSYWLFLYNAQWYKYWHRLFRLYVTYSM